MSPSHIWNKSAAPYKKTIQILKVFVCGGGESENSIRFLSFQRAAWCPDKAHTIRNTAKVVIIAYMLIITPRRKLAYIYTLYIMYTHTSIHKQCNNHTISNYNCNLL